MGFMSLRRLCAGAYIHSFSLIPIFVTGFSRHNKILEVRKSASLAALCSSGTVALSSDAGISFTFCDLDFITESSKFILDHCDFLQRSPQFHTEARNIFSVVLVKWSSIAQSRIEPYPNGPRISKYRSDLLT